jgi:predicted nucleic acid-binding protein
MARISKQRGYGLEYKIVNWFNNEEKRVDWPLGWESERNTLSREEKKFGVTTAKHDVKALKCLTDGAIFLQLEAKKTGKELHTIQKQWIDKINFHNDELLVIAFSRSENFAVIDIERMPWFANIKNDPNDQLVLATNVYIDALVIKAIEGSRLLKCRGTKSVRIHKEDIEPSTLLDPVILNWETINRRFCVFPLSEFVALREQRPPNITLQQAAGLKKQAENADTPVVEADIQKEITITCPRTGLPLKVIPFRSPHG